MRKTVLSCLLAFCATLASAQLNMTLTDQIDYTPQVSSLWGYIDPEDSTEYAAVGVATGLSVVDLSDPYNVQEIAFIPDVNSQWREVKSWGHYIYAVTEGGGGLLVVNMTNPNNVTSTHWAPNIPGVGTLNKIHSITVDEFGYLYLNGSNLNSGGPLIVDVSADNGNPVYVGKLPAIYCHDSYARNNRLYTSDIYAGNFKVYDVTNPASPILLATQQTPYNFTHNTWLNDAGNVIFTTDEKANAPVGVYDISDLDNIVELDQFRPVATIGLGTIPHNVHVWNDWVITAYYTNGTIILDGSRPENMIEVGYFDSFVPQVGGFYGVWGVYPYFPSGVVIASDMQNGLLVYDVNYVRACWLEGKVTNAITGGNVSGATVHIESTQANAATTDLLGSYKTGQAIPGTFDVVVSATGYFPRTVSATLENGVLTILNVKLEPMTIAQFPAYSFTAPTSGCAPLSVDFFENSDIVISWNWTFENGDPATSTEQNPSVDFDVAGLHDVSLQVVTYGGNTYNISTNDLVTIAPSPTADFSSSLDSLTASFTNTSVHYNNLIWDFGDGGTSTAINPEYTYHGPGTYTVTLTTYGDCGSGISTQEVTISEFLPVASFGTNMVSGCAPMTVAFNDQSTNTPTEWAWSFPGGSPATSTEQNPMVSYLNSGTYDVQLIATNSAGSSEALQSDLIVVNESPSAGFSTATNGPEANFSNNSTGDIETYSWDFGDGQTSDEESPFHTYATAGTYEVILTVNNNCGASNYTQEVTIPDFLPTAGFNADITAGCAPLTVAYTDQSSGQLTGWEWTFLGGTPATSTDQNPVVTYGSAGVYPVALTVENAWGTAEISQNDLITVNDVPTVDFSFNITVNEVAFTNNTNNALTYEWSFNDGSGDTSTELDPVHNFPGPGTYEVTLSATNGCGTATYTTNVIIAAIEPTAAFDLDFTGDCAPIEVQFTDQSEGQPTAWAWSFPGGTPATSTDQNPTVTYTAAGTYSATLTVTNSAGTSEAVLTDFVTVDAAPQTGFTANVDELDVSFTNTSTNANSYAWDFGDGSATNGQINPAYTYVSNGNYTVTLTATNGCGSTTYEQTIVIEVDAPVAAFSNNQTAGCVPFEVTYTDESEGIVTGWAWTFPGGTPAFSTEQNPTVTYSTPGTYSAGLEVTGPGGVSTAVVTNPIEVGDVPTGGFELNMLYLGATFINYSENADTYAWDFGDGVGTSTEANPGPYLYAEPGIYTVTLIATNECGSSTFTQTANAQVYSAEESALTGSLLTASPNPFGNQLTVSYELKRGFEKASITATNVLGERVAELPIHTASGTINWSDGLGGSGVYFLRLVVDGQVGKALKVVKL